MSYDGLPIWKVKERSLMDTIRLQEETIQAEMEKTRKWQRKYFELVEQIKKQQQQQQQ